MQNSMFLEMNESELIDNEGGLNIVKDFLNLLAGAEMVRDFLYGFGQGFKDAWK